MSGDKVFLTFVKDLLDSYVNSFFYLTSKEIVTNECTRKALKMHIESLKINFSLGGPATSTSPSCASSPPLVLSAFLHFPNSP